MKAKVVSKFYSNGKVTKEIFLESEWDLVPCEGEFVLYDLYVDTFNSAEEAEKYIKEN